MKKATIASLIMSAAAVFAAGCSAETGAPGAGEQIGSSSEALTLAAGNAFPVALKSPGSCVVQTPNGTDHYMLTFGGFTATTGTPVADIYRLKAGVDTWAHAKLTSNNANDANLAVARGQIQAIQLKDDLTSCLVVGGSTTFNGNALASTGSAFVVEKVTIDNSGFLTITNASGGSNYAQLARTRFRLASCDSGSHRVVAFGGIDNSGNYVKTIATFDTGNPATAWSVANTFVNPRADFGFAQEGENFVVAGGENTGGLIADLEMIKSSTCSTWTVPAAATAFPTSSPNFVKREGTATVLYDTNKFMVVGGLGTTAVKGDSLKFTVNWTTPAITAGTLLSGPALNGSAVTAYPNVLQSGTTPYLVNGGNDTSLDTFTTDGYQTSSTTPAWSSGNLVTTNGRIYGAAELLSGKIYSVAGSKIVSGTETLLSTTEVITP